LLPGEDKIMNKLIIATTSAVLMIGGAASAQADTSEAECATRFEQADVNKDGKLEPNEAELYVVAMEKVEVKPKEVIQVTRAEFLVACRKDAFVNIKSATGQPAASSEQALAASAKSVLASSLIGTSVYTKNDTSIGEINDLILDQEDKASDKVIVGVGGFLGIGEKDVVLDRSRLNFVATPRGVKVVVDTNETELKSLQAYTKQ
jgi:sporulation protein YlmC with PRC-barrel domain